jgi:hypothetical protein
MEKNEIFRYVSNELSNGRDVNFKYKIDKILYKIKFLASNSSKGINISSILAIPLSERINNRLVVVFQYLQKI